MTETQQAQTKFDQWCVVELMGHQRIAGKVTEESHFGVALMRVDVPATDGRDGFTKYFGGNAIYAVTPTTEQVATHVAKMVDQAPISRWEMRELLPTTVPSVTSEYDDPTSDEEAGYDPDDDPVF